MKELIGRWNDNNVNKIKCKQMEGTNLNGLKDEEEEPPRGDTSKKSRKYVSKNIGCNILVVGYKYILIG